MSEFKRENTCYMRSTTLVDENSSAQIISEKDITTGETRLKIIDNPTRRFWVTKKALRNHEQRKELETLNNLDEYRVPEHRFTIEAHKALHGWYPRGYCSFFKMKGIQYLYGADISLDVLTKLEYMKHCSTIGKIHIGALDIEQSVLGDNQIIVITYIDMMNKQVHTHVLHSFLKEHIPSEIGTLYKKEYAEFYEVLKKHGLVANKKTPEYIKYLDGGDLKYHLHVCNSEKDLITSIFEALHLYKPDFVIGWNIEYDLMAIEERSIFRGLDPKDIFCHPDVPEKYRHYSYSKGKIKAHIVDKWSVPKVSGYTEFVDAMCLYARLRIVAGRDISYGLDYISNKELGSGKLNIDDGNTHVKLQREQPVAYAAYNIFDVLLLILLELKNHDIENMIGVLGESVVYQYAYMTVQGGNMMYEYFLKNGAILSTTIGKQSTEYDKYINLLGGAVLSPVLLVVKGVPIIKGSNHPTTLYRYVSDQDVSSQYPSTLISFNISKETKLESIIYIHNFGPNEDELDYELMKTGSKAEQKKETSKRDARFFHIEDFMMGVAFPQENSVSVCNKFFNMPNYIEMRQLIKKEK